MSTFDWKGRSMPPTNLSEFLDGILPYLAEYIRQARWFGSKGKPVIKASIIDYTLISPSHSQAFFIPLILKLEYRGSFDIYHVPLAILKKDSSADTASTLEGKIILHVTAGRDVWLVVDGCSDRRFNLFEIGMIVDEGNIKSHAGIFEFEHTGFLAENKKDLIPVNTVKFVSSEQSNSSTIFNMSFIFKHFRKLEDGVNPEYEVLKYLCSCTQFRNIPMLAGSLQYHGRELESTVGVLQSYVENYCDGWTYLCGKLRHLYDNAIDLPLELGDVTDIIARKFCADDISDARQLGEITGGLHMALATGADQKAFDPERITSEDVEGWSNTTRGNFYDTITDILENSDMQQPVRDEVIALLDKKEKLFARLESLDFLVNEGVFKIRVHGDYHLGQVLKTDKGFTVFDFEGEPARPLGYRRRKNCALKDVAGMLRSFDYAVHSTLFERGNGRQHPEPKIRSLGLAWRSLVCNAFLDGYYRETIMKRASFLPSSIDLANKILSSFVIDKAIYELGYEANNRLAWIGIPLEGIKEIISDDNPCIFREWSY